MRYTGEGIEPKEQERIFERFACGKHNRYSDGFGLGLARELGIPVVTMAAAQGYGVDELKRRIGEYVMSDSLSRAY